jgi:gamma-glutamyltranspeptidase/glutathione hydrolase
MPAAGAAPIPSDAARLLPVRAAHGMVSSQEKLATAIGVDVLRRGGNAVDAAVAVGFALAVTLPRAGNLGGGGFMLVHLAAKDGRPADTVAIDYRETAPAAATRDMFLDARGEPDPAKSRDSGLSVGVPGTVAGLALAHERYGSGRFTLAELVRPAERLARDGITVEDDLADSLPGAARLGRHAATRAIFYKGDRPLGHGDRLVQRDLADTLAVIAERGADGFHRGPVAEKIAAAVQAAGGVMNATDLASYQPVLRKPVRGAYRDHEIVSMPPPSSGGAHLIQILNTLERFDLAAAGAGGADSVHLLAEAMKPAYADRAAWLGDPDRVKVPVAGLTSKRYAAGLASKIDLARARPADAVAAGDPLPFESDQTTHFSVVDRDGNAVANTYTLNFSYGGRAGGGGHGRAPQQRDGRLRREGRRGERLRARRRRRELGLARRAPVVLHDADLRVPRRAARARDGQPRRQPHHLDRAAGRGEHARFRAEHRRSGGGAARPSSMAAGRAPRSSVACRRTRWRG